MSSSIKIKNIIKNFLMENEYLMDKESCNIIIPFAPSGYKAYSNFGYVKGQFKIDNFLTYKRLFTGDDAFQITWKGATSIAPKLKNGKIQIDWKLGEYILGWNEGLSSDVNIQNDESFSDYKKQNATNTITFRIRADEYDLSEEYKYLFYKLPEISKDILYRVVSLETEYIGRAKVCYVLTLQSLQQDLESTGRAKSQNVMPNSPGQGMYEPLILEDPKKEDFVDYKPYVQVDQTRWITINESKFIHDPVKKMVLKLFGLGYLMNFSLVGRKITKLFPMTEYGIPRLIFPINLKQATTPTLYRTQQSTDNYYFVWGLYPEIQFSKDILEGAKDLIEVNKVWSQQGIVTLPGKPDITDGIANTGLTCQVTNPKEGDGTYKYSLYGYISQGQESPFPIWTPWRFSIPDDVIGDNKGVLGSAITYKISKNVDRVIHDYLWDSYWLNKKLLVLPINKRSTLTFGQMTNQGISSLFSLDLVQMIMGAPLFWIGMLGTILTDVPKRTLDNSICGIFPAALLDFMTAEASVSLPKAIAERAWFKLSYLLNEETQTFLTFFNTETMNTSFEADLTDLFEKDGRTYETTLIGQTQQEDGSHIPGLGNGQQLLVSGGEKLVPIEEDDVGFIIDSFNLQAIFSGDFSVEFLNKDNQIIWSGVYQSEAKWTNSLREINTWRNTSIYGRENTFLEEPKPWPAEIKLAPWGAGIDDRETTINHVLELKYNDDAKKGLLELWQGHYDKLENAWPHAQPSEEQELLDKKSKVDRFPEFSFIKSISIKDILLTKSTKPIKEEDFWRFYKKINLKVEYNGKPYTLTVFDKTREVVTHESSGGEFNVHIGWTSNNNIQQGSGDEPTFNDAYNKYITYRREPGIDGDNATTDYLNLNSLAVTLNETIYTKITPTLRFPKKGNAYMDLEIEYKFNFKADIYKYVKDTPIPSGFYAGLKEVLESKLNLYIDSLCLGKKINDLQKPILGYPSAWTTISPYKASFNHTIKVVSAYIEKK